MKIEPVITPGAVRTRLLNLITTCDTFSLASAWVTGSDVFDAALAEQRKLRHFVIGTHHLCHKRQLPGGVRSAASGQSGGARGPGDIS